MSERVERELEQARELLLDLSLRNRLLNFRPTRRTTIPVIDQDPDRTWQTLVTDGKSLAFRARPEEEQESPSASNDRHLRTDLAPDELRKNLLQTQRTARSAIEEKGANFLHLALGFVHWVRQDQLERELSAPILLLPVRLERLSAERGFALWALDDDPVVNPSLAALLERQYGIGLPPGPEDWDGFAPSSYLDQVAAAIEPLSDWRVEPGQALGLFSFSKYLMYLDLDPKRWPESDPLVTRPQVARLCGVESGRETGPVTGLDAGRAVDDLWCVMDADGSQLEAIQAAARGESLVVEGPPGTGKSQTITNMLSACLAEGKTVLFVAEKLAALQVVKRRMDQVGLGDHCLELHSTKANRKAVLAQIDRALQQGRLQAPDDDRTGQELTEVRNRLDGYVQDLHRPLQPCGLTPYQMVAELVGLAEAPDVPEALPGTEDWDADRIDDLEQAVARHGQRLQEVWPTDAHPFRGCALTEVGQLDLQAIRADLEKTALALDSVKQAAGQAARALGGPQPDSLAEARSHQDLTGLFADSPGVAERLLAEPYWEQLTPDCMDLLEQLGRLVALRTWAAERYQADLVLSGDVDWTAVHTRWRIQWASWFRVFRPAYWRDRRTLRSACAPGHEPGYSRGLKDLEKLAEWLKTRSAVVERDDEGRRAFDAAWAGPDSDPQALTSLAAWLQKARPAVVRAEVGQEAIAAAGPTGNRDRLRAAAQAAGEALKALDVAAEALWQRLRLDLELAYSGPLEKVPFQELAERLATMLRELESLHAWADYRKSAQAIASGPLAGFVDRALADRLPPKKIDLAFRKRLLAQLFERALARRPWLGEFAGSDREADQRRFAELDRAWLVRIGARLAARLSERRPVTAFGAAASSQLGILLGEIRRKRGGRSIRRMLADSGDLVQRCKPVFMMSPLSVAQFLTPGRIAFDVVIFDEASQVEPADALGAIARGRQLVLVGDSNQLPPTSFFRAVEAGGEEESADEGEAAGIADMESILDRGSMCLPQRRLRWHFRSRHDSLIAFSNQAFYQGDLVVTPANQRRAEDLGLQVQYHPEDGYDRGGSQTNADQAARIARWVFDHAKAHPELSLGVGAFSQRQQQAVLDAVEQLRTEDNSIEAFFAEDLDEPFFVKNLETIQGDERDVIVLSVGYGKREQGDRLSMNFGPLNQQGGWRRLNVLVTRARRRCVVFTSIRPEDFDLGATDARGVHALCDYLRFAFHGPAAGPSSAAGDLTGLAGRVVADLTARGLEVHQRVGPGGAAVDLALPDPDRADRYPLGLLLDGPGYSAARTTRERERTRQQVLEGLGWRIRRIWSVDWARTPDRECDRLVAAFEAAREGRLEPLFAGSRPSASGPLDLAQREVDAQALGFAAYRTYRPPRIGKPEEFYEQDLRALATRLTDIVSLEGPIHTDELMHRLAEAWGLARAGSKVRALAEKAAHAAETDGQIARRGDFWWPAGLDVPPVRKREDDRLRDAERICPEELGQGAWQLLRIQGAMIRDDLITQTARALGFAATGAAISKAIGLAIDAEAASGRIRTDRERLEAVEPGETSPGPAANEPAAPEAPAPKEGTCPGCGQDLEPSERFCPECGTRNPAARPDRCPACDRKLKASHRFCPDCGHRIAD